MTNLKLRPIIDQTGTCYYKTGKVISKYLKPLTKNEFVIKNTQKDFPAMLNNIPLSQDEEDVSYDVESLFTNILIKDTIDFICEEIYVHKLEPICKNSIFKKLLYKLTMECTFRKTSETSRWCIYGRHTLSNTFRLFHE